MKKLLAMVLAAFAVTTQAASFNWGTGTVKASFDGTAFTTADYSVTAYLVYLSDGDTSKMFTIDYTAPGTITGADGNSTATPATTGSNANKGKVKGKFDDALVANGNTFGMYIKYTDSTGVSWFNFSSDTYTVSGLSTGGEVLDDAVYSFNFGTKTQITSSSQSPSAGGGWYSIQVPEPSTAALALAGLALLIKRRRA